MILRKSLWSALLFGLATAAPVSADTEQIGFAHRVNDWDEIGPALSAGVNGIEIDICWGGGAFRSDDWYVSHNDANVCANASAEHLGEWMGELKSQLNGNSSYKRQLVALWIDIKDLSDYDKLPQAVRIIQNSGLPRDLTIIYDLTGYDKNSKAGFEKIHGLLRQNEGISLCAGKSCGGSLASVGEIYQLYKDAGFKRGGFNTGDSVSINRAFLSEANKPEYNQLLDPYRFKFVHTWTNRYEGTMENYIDQSASFRTTGQIVGEWGTQWDGYMRYIASNFKDAVGDVPDVHFATKSDQILRGYRKGDFGRFSSVAAPDRCLDVIASATQNGQNLELRGCDGGKFQHWQMIGDGTLRLRANAGKCLDPEGPSYGPGTPLQIWDCAAGYAPHAWTYGSVSKTIRPRDAQNMCVGLTGGATGTGTTITLQPCSGAASQQWRFVN